jgi:cytoskeletal protein CcmA (bactofilin family)
MSNPEKQTLVEEGTEFSGTLKSKCKVVVRGSVDGDLVAPAVDVAEGGAVTGNVRAESVQSAGVLAGQVDADDIRLAGEVRSNTVIKAKSLEVKLSSQEGKLEVTFGDCVLDVGDLPAKEDIVAPMDGEKAEPAEAAPEPAEAADESGGGGRGRRKRRRNRKNDAEAEAKTEESSAEAAEGAESDAPASPPAE